MHEGRQWALMVSERRAIALAERASGNAAFIAVALKNRFRLA